MIDSPALNTFLDDLITKKHGADLSSVGREQIKKELSPRLEKWLILKNMELASGDTAPSTAFLTSALIEFSNAYLA